MVVARDLEGFDFITGYDQDAIRPKIEVVERLENPSSSAGKSAPAKLLDAVWPQADIPNVPAGWKAKLSFGDPKSNG